MLIHVALRALLPSLCLVAVACTRGQAVTFEGGGVELTVQRPALYPETIEYNPRSDHFLVSSFREGAVYEIDQAGKASLLVDDPRLCSVLGIALDVDRQRVWVVNSDLGASLKPSSAGAKRLAAVGVYDLTTGKALEYVDLAPLGEGPHLLNGIALDSEGNAYVTDSLSPVIYRVSSQGSASVFVRDPRFAGSAINLNGVVVHPDGYLLVVKKSDGSLFKVPLRQPKQLTRVAVDQRFVGGDGLTFIAKNALVIIANRTPELSSDAAFSLASEDGWVTARVSAVHPLGDAYPTTAVLRRGTLYVLRSKLNELIASPPEQQGKLREKATIRAIAHVAP